jgi:endonuclease YncB( thermonuclease family)
MKHLQFCLLSLFILLCAGTGFSQLKFGGRVIDVIDGKTVVIEMESGRLTAVLQYIETPEPEQPLFQTVKDHLGRLVLGQFVDFQPKGVLPTKTLGTMYLKGLDIAQQMVRDGAAWHIPAEKSGQSPQDGELYRSNELQAKNERRGVWSIQNLKPAWEFREAKNENEKQKKIDEWNVYLENSAANRPAAVSRTRRQTAEERMQANENVGI